MTVPVEIRSVVDCSTAPSVILKPEPGRSVPTRHILVVPDANICRAIVPLKVRLNSKQHLAIAPSWSAGDDVESPSLFTSSNVAQLERYRTM